MSRARASGEAKVELEPEERQQQQQSPLAIKLCAAFEQFVTYAGKEVDEEDEDVIVYVRVEIKRDICPKESKLLKGEKYLRVDLRTLTGEAVFRLKMGAGCRIAAFDLKTFAPSFGGEHKNSPPSLA
jgi:hypothetical protein